MSSRQPQKRAFEYQNPRVAGASDVSKRTGHLSCAYENKLMLVWGGRQNVDNDCTTRFVDPHLLYVYWPKLENLCLLYLTKMPPIYPTTNSCGIIIGDHLAIFGGVYHPDLVTKIVSNDLYLLNLTTMIWEKSKPTNELRPTPRSNHTGWEYNGQLWFFGGQGPEKTEPGPQPLSSDRPETVDMLPWQDSPGFGSFGNSPDHGNMVNNQLLCYNPQSRTWSNPCCKGQMPAPRHWHTTVNMGDGRVILFGGESAGGMLNDLYLLLMRSLTWVSVITTSVDRPAPRYQHAAAKIANEKLAVYGGKVRFGHSMGDLWTLDTESFYWEQSELTLGERHGHTAVEIQGDIYFHAGTQSIIVEGEQIIQPMERPRRRAAAFWGFSRRDHQEHPPPPPRAPREPIRRVWRHHVEKYLSDTLIFHSPSLSESLEWRCLRIVLALGIGIIDDHDRLPPRYRKLLQLAHHERGARVSVKVAQIYSVRDLARLSRK